MALHDLGELYLDQIRDLYSAETQIVDALPKLIEAASHEQLRAGFQHHLDQTREHVRRLEQIAQRLNEDADGKTCHGMKGLLKEGKETMKEREDSDVLDAALIADAQRVEHYEIAAYGTAIAHARLLELDGVVNLLEETLEEEKEADRKLTALHSLATNRFLNGPVLNALQRTTVDDVQLVHLKIEHQYVAIEETKAKTNATGRPTPAKPAKPQPADG